MRRRRVIVGLVVLAGTVAAVTFRPRGPRPCRETFELVRQGMTYDEVCATVGAPPYDPYAILRSNIGGEYWYGSDAELCVYFDPAGRADRISVNDFTRESGWSRLRAWLGL